MKMHELYRDFSCDEVPSILGIPNPARQENRIRLIYTVGTNYVEKMANMNRESAPIALPLGVSKAHPFAFFIPNRRVHIFLVYY